MKRPHGELVQCDFYFHNKHWSDAMCDVVRHCLDRGASLTGEIQVSQFDNARSTRLTSVYSEPIYEKLVDEQGLWRQFNEDDTHVLTVGVRNAIGASRNVPDIVTFNGASEDTPLNEPNPISIVSEGWVLSTPGYETERYKLGRKLHRYFVAACDALQPTYAAILNEDSLTCPHDLQRGKGVDCFHNFFISQQVFGRGVCASVEAMYADAYTQRTAGGIYVATWIFSPKNIVLEGKSRLQRSKKVAKILADHLACQGLFDS